MLRKKIITSITGLAVIGSIMILPIARGQILPAGLYEDNPDFHPKLIINDSDVTNFSSLSLWEIQQFLLSKQGSLAFYRDPTTNLTGSEIIYQTAQTYQINPKFLLVLIQKEQSLVEDPSPAQKQYDWATGYSCYGGQCSESYRGFSVQLNAAANLFINRYFADLATNNCTITNWCIGQAKTTQDGHIITPQNRATAALYTYTPYRGGTITNEGKVGANYNFWKIWNRWFGSIGGIAFWPDGTLLKMSGSSTVYVIQNQTRRPIASLAVLKSRYDAKNVITVATSTVMELPLGSAIRFAQYSLIQTPNKKIYLLVDNTKRLIVSSEDFRKLGFNPEEVELADYADLAYLADGLDLSADTKYNLGALVKDLKSGGIYYVLSSIKHPIIAPEIIKINFPNLKTRVVSAKQLAAWEIGAPVQLKDGLLVKTKTNSAVYVISQGKKYTIPSAKIFNSRGYNWKNILTIQDKVLALHEDGGSLAAINTATSTSTTPSNSSQP